MRPRAATTAAAGSVHDVKAKARLQGSYGTADHGLPGGDYEVMVKDDRQKSGIREDVRRKRGSTAR